MRGSARCFASVLSMLLLAFAGVACVGNRRDAAAPGNANAVPAATAPAVANGQDAYPFAAPTPAASLRKVRFLLTGGTPTEAELAAYQADPNALPGLVDAWMKTDAYRAALLDFFAVQFQQTQMVADAFAFNMYDQENITPSDTTQIAMRESFARTVLALMDEGAPFTQAFTTTRHMMTTELMSYYVYTDTSTLTDDGSRQTRWYTGNPNVGPTFRKAAGPVSLADAANPTSKNYLTFYEPNLTSAYAHSQASAAEVATCSSVDPVVLTNMRTFARASEWGMTVWNVLHGSGFFFFYPEEFQPTTIGCSADDLQNTSIWTDADANDWRMVQVRPPAAGEHLTEFFDLDNLRQGNVLLMNGERVSFFSTPAFLAQWGTNASNSSRAALNQTLIAALGHQVDGNDLLPMTSPTAVDPNHAADPACFACHQTLDPMRQLFRQSYTLTYSPQQDAAEQALPAAFAFRGSTQATNRVTGLGQALAQHPQLAQAWTLKLCAWANSAPCVEDDPEVLRIASLFAASNFNFNALAKALFTSPLVTYAASTATVRQNGQVASVVRRQQLCRALSTRLGRPDLCALATASPDGQNTLPSRAAALPADGYSRGVDAPLYVTVPEPFYVGNLENICALAAEQAVDPSSSATAAWASSRNVDAALQQITQVLMGVPAAQAATPTALLQAHVTQAMAAGASATTALRSAFVSGCLSAATITVGQ